VRVAATAGAAGLLVGVGLAFLFEHLDDSIKTKEEAERVGEDVPVIGLVPRSSRRRGRDGASVVSIRDPRSPSAEAYRALRTALQFMGLDRPMGTIQVTSPAAREGKSTTLANLGVAMARAGQRVIIVCCDLRRPGIHELFGLDNAIGFTSVLLGEVVASDALQPVPGEERLSLLASGPIPPNPSELLSGRRTVEVLTALQAQADVVLVDCPPVLPVTDAVVLSRRVDATLLVLSAGETTRNELVRTLEVLGQVDAPLVGMVLNGTSSEGSYGYSYRYPPRKEDRSSSGGARRRKVRALMGSGLARRSEAAVGRNFVR
jgi:non-specific protein-tyrosine kinase